MNERISLGDLAESIADELAISEPRVLCRLLEKYSGERAAHSATTQVTISPLLELLCFALPGATGDTTDTQSATSFLASRGVDVTQELSLREYVDALLRERQAAMCALPSNCSPRGALGLASKTAGSRRGKGKLQYWARKISEQAASKEAEALAQTLEAKADDDKLELADMAEIRVLYANYHAERANADIRLLELMQALCFVHPAGIELGDLEFPKRLFQYGKVQESYEWHALLADKYPKDAELQNNLGFILLYLGRLPEARIHLEQASVLGQADIAVHCINRGVLETLSQNYPDAERWLDRAVELATDTDSVAAEMVLFLNDRMSVPDADKKFVLTDGSAKAIALCNLAYVQRTTRTDGAGRSLEAAVALEKTGCYALRARGWFFFDEDRHREAKSQFERAHQRAPDHPFNDWERSLLPMPYLFF